MGGGVLKGQCNEILKEYFLINFFFCPVQIVLLKVLPSCYVSSCFLISIVKAGDKFYIYVVFV
jgi:hypothetical protein